MRGCIALCISCLALVACGDNSNQELRQWMSTQRAQVVPKVTPVSEPKKYHPQDYAQAEAIEPFSNLKLLSAFKAESGQSVISNKLIAPELKRRKEPLEAFPLDAMAMVGSLNRGGKHVALIRVDRLLYQVHAGNYLGQNYGRVGAITETEVVLREIVQDPTGDWIERTATLQLQERAK